jgi:hypothetical protein
VGAQFYRDRTANRIVEQEVIPFSSWINAGNSPIAQWRFQTRYSIVKGMSDANYGNSPDDLEVFIDGIPWPASEVFGINREVTLVDKALDDASTERWVYLPEIDENTIVTVNYWTNDNRVKVGVGQTVFYRLTTVAACPHNPEELVETPLDRSPPLSIIQVETIDYIWKEAIRRNQWILQQGGERVKVFVRKTFGQYCTCALDPRTRVYSGQPKANCLTCFGTGIAGGYEGPYDILIGPEDAERKITQTPQGRRLEMMYEVWTGPYPLVTQRDFIVRQTNERFSIGPVRRPSARGNYLQQHFQISYLDTPDIRYQVPITGTTELAWPQIRYTDTLFTGEPGKNRHDPTVQPIPTGPSAVTPMETDAPQVPDNREIRGRTPVWKNTTYGGS